MNRSIKSIVLLISISLFVFSVVSAQTPGGKSTEIQFPDVAGWEKGDKATYPNAELGYSIPYQSETGGTVTIYVYNGGFKSIADGIGDQNVINEIRKAEGDIKAYGEAGYYQDVKFVKSETVALGGSGGRSVLYTLFSFKVRGVEVDSEIYLFGYKNNFVKIRATRAKGRNGAENTDVAALLSKLDAIFLK